MAKYMLLIQGDRDTWEDIPARERERIVTGHERFRDAAGDAVVGGHELAPAGAATTVRARGGARPAVTDGPFLETKEIVGGYYVIDVPDLDAALELALLLPEATAAYAAGIEVRPVLHDE